MQKLRMGVIGTGKIAQVLHIPNIINSEYAELIALSNPHEEKMEKIKKLYKIEVDTYTDYETMLNRDDIDAVVVSTPNVYHAEISIKALSKGKHVLVEKPMATSSSEALRMIETAQDARRVLMVNHSQRFFPHHMKAREILESGILGEVRFVKTMFGHPGPENWSETARWFFEKDRAAFGALGDLGVHKIDLIRYLTNLEIVECVTMINTLEKSGDVEDIASAVLKLSNGALASLNVNWVTRGLEENYIAVYGEYGTIKVGYGSPNRIDIFLAKPVEFHGSIELQPLFTNKDPYWRMPVIDHFAKVVLGLEDPISTPEDGYMAVKVVESLVRSHIEGRVVKLNG